MVIKGQFNYKREGKIQIAACGLGLFVLVVRIVTRCGSSSGNEEIPLILEELFKEKGSPVAAYCEFLHEMYFHLICLKN